MAFRSLFLFVFIASRGGVDHGEALGAGRVRARCNGICIIFGYLTKIDIRLLIKYFRCSDAG